MLQACTSQSATTIVNFCMRQGTRTPLQSKGVQSLPVLVLKEPSWRLSWQRLMVSKNKRCSPWNMEKKKNGSWFWKNIILLIDYDFLGKNVISMSKLAIVGWGEVFLYNFEILAPIPHSPLCDDPIAMELPRVLVPRESSHLMSKIVQPKGFIFNKSPRWPWILS